MSLWGGRFQDGSSAMFRRVNDSLPFDRALASQDIRGSIAWSKAIYKAGVLTQDEQHQHHDDEDLQLAIERFQELLDVVLPAEGNHHEVQQLRPDQDGEHH